MHQLFLTSVEFSKKSFRAAYKYCERTTNLQIRGNDFQTMTESAIGEAKRARRQCIISAPYLPWSLYRPKRAGARDARAFSALHLNETDRFHRARTHESELLLSARVACIAPWNKKKKKRRKEIHTGDEEVIYADISYTRDVWGFAASLCHCQIPARCSSRHNRDDPYFPAAMRQASPRAIPRFVPSFFTPLVISPAPKFTFHVVASVYRFSHPPPLRATHLRLPSLLRDGTRPAGVATIVHRFRWNSPR